LERYDLGDSGQLFSAFLRGFLKATVELALKRRDLGRTFREYLRDLNL
jgi:hypothetical protein